jgi:hypothetical protein
MSIRTVAITAVSWMCYLLLEFKETYVPVLRFTMC